MYAAGAPSYYIVVNVAALAAGSLAAWLIRRIPVHDRQSAGIFTVAVGLMLLGIALLGPRVNGAARWIRIAGISLQPSLMLLPPAMVVYARNRTWLSSLGLIFAALALALQPDRAMAGTLAAALAVLWLYRRDPLVAISLAAASCAFAATLVRSDDVPPAPFVEQVVQSAFAFDTLAGLAIVVALIAMLIPAIVGAVTRKEAVAEFVVFGVMWLVMIGFAVAGNFPTPLAGYGTSGIVGYCLSAALLERRPAPRRPTRTVPHPPL